MIKIPRRVRKLPLVKVGAYTIHKPWFVEADDFRVVDSFKASQSRKYGTCWICGMPNSGPFVFVTGPLSAGRNVSSEPPCHRACAEYATKVCPFIMNPNRERREEGLSEKQIVTDDPRFIAKNPGVFYLTGVKYYRIMPPMDGVIYARYRAKDIRFRHKYVNGEREDELSTTS